MGDAPVSKANTPTAFDLPILQAIEFGQGMWILGDVFLRESPPQTAGGRGNAAEQAVQERGVPAARLKT